MKYAIWFWRGLTSWLSELRHDVPLQWQIATFGLSMAIAAVTLLLLIRVG